MRNVPHNLGHLNDLNAWSQWCCLGRFRGCGLIKGSKSLEEGVIANFDCQFDDIET